LSSARELRRDGDPVQLRVENPAVKKRVQLRGILWKGKT
jgi:hypothetical protein